MADAFRGWSIVACGVGAEGVGTEGDAVPWGEPDGAEATSGVSVRFGAAVEGEAEGVEVRCLAFGAEFELAAEGDPVADGELAGGVEVAPVVGGHDEDVDA